MSASNTLPSKILILNQNHPLHYSVTHHRPTQNLSVLFLPSPPTKPSRNYLNANMSLIMSSLLIKSPMAQWLRRPTVTTHSNREIRSSILRGGVSLFALFCFLPGQFDRSTIAAAMERTGAWSLWCAAVANQLPHTSSFEPRAFACLPTRGFFFVFG